ncbi:N-acetylmuramoyl-L-alanine amidase CwlD [Clostridium ihumii]|uniref:N-acetylmuramoyl-L-alanine amidase CwlD n=1 Tax=Clostridium ihumii TaxID=1470356 RepID=UPI0005906BFF|nr:N-acetylmuramoyl-L-alanine amidase CwlD [Clostridium ihumii]
MKKQNNLLTIALATILICFAAILTINLNSSKLTMASNDEGGESNTKIILIDPGHGGIDGGASAADGTVEKNINLNIALELAKLLKENGFKVFLTRDEDRGLYSDSGSVKEKKIQDLNERCKLKKDTNCDLFISIHLNKFSDASCKGAQVWYSKNSESEEIANIIQSNLVADLDSSNHRKPKFAKDMYKVLRTNDDMPGVIVECGFLSNNQDLSNLKNESYQKKVADSLNKSIKNYFEGH